MCPFDSKDSLFVKTLLLKGHNVIYGIDDFLTTEYEYDYLVTNPPLALKILLLKKYMNQENKVF